MSDPRTLGRYQIEGFLGKGSFAEVYKATDIMLKRVVALKVLKPALMADEEAFSRFTHEAQVLAGLVHPRIAWVWDLGEADGRYFIAMRYVEGRSLDKVLAERGALTLEETLRITKQIVDALEFAHEQELVHRDVKPQNIIISEKEGAVLTDFGLVKVMQSSGMTGTGNYLGTPQYMAPELWDGKEASKASDQYALACLVAEMLIGKTLFDGTTPVVIRKHLMEEPVLPLELPEKVMKALRCALSKDPAERHESIQAFVDALSASPEAPKSPAQESIIRQENEPQSMVEVISEQISTRKTDSLAGIINNELVLKLADDVEMSFVRVLAGEFLIGSEMPGDEGPQHKVSLEEYWIGKTPVTNIQYRAFVTIAGKLAPKKWQDGKIPGGKEKHPVVNVSWNDAIAFCVWMSKITEETIRLPSEAEWEKAARGTNGNTYPWGAQAPDRKLCNFNGIEKDTTQVGKYSPAGDSIYGCQDMAGNSWEWVNSLYIPYPYVSDDGRENMNSSEKRVLRSGTWNSDGNSVRSAYRYWNFAAYSDYTLGFRCCFTLPTPKGGNP